MTEFHPEDYQDINQEWSEFKKSLVPKNGYYSPEHVTIKFLTFALNEGINVTISDEQGSTKLTRCAKTSYNGEAEIMLMGVGEDLRIAFRLDNKADACFKNHFANR